MEKTKEVLISNQKQLKAILACTYSGHVRDEVLLQEFYELARAAGILVVGHLSQRQKKEGCFFGSGKIQELQNKVRECGANLVLVNGNLSPIQSRNLENFLKVPIMERTQLILKIFSDRAQSYEGRLQVELARCLDELPRVRGAWLGSLSRQGGGVGARRGPGEKAIETDRRQIQKKIRILKKKLLSVRKTRFQQRKLRHKQQVCNFALIGYTNSGKSSLMNYLSGSKVPAEQHVFLTLDPITRKVFVPGVSQAVLTDTVGFIQDLPTHLIEAFKATLEESDFADVLLHVIDLSNPNMQEQIEVVNKLIKELKWDSKPCIHVYNKLDRAPRGQVLNIRETSFRSLVSAHTGEGIKHLMNEMKRAFFSLKTNASLFFPTSEEQKIYELGREAQIYKTEQGRGGTLCFTRLSHHQLSQWRSFIVKGS